MGAVGAALTVQHVGSLHTCHPLSLILSLSTCGTLPMSAGRWCLRPRRRPNTDTQCARARQEGSVPLRCVRVLDMSGQCR